MSKKRVVVTVDMSFNGGQEPIRLLEEAGFEVVQEYGGPDWSDADTIRKLEGAHAILAGGELFDASTLEGAKDLQIIARNGAGYDKVDLEYCTGRGIYATNTPGAMADAVADEAIGLLLAAVRGFTVGDASVKGGGYSSPLGEDLASMTLGLVGCGHIGREVVRRARAFKMRVLVYDPWVEAAALEAIGAEKATLEEMLPQVDAVTLHTPLTADNKGMVNGDFLGRMKPGGYIINTARGGLVDEEALLAALQSGQLAGAGLDCQASEPPVGLSLEVVRHPKVVAMPHAGSYTHTGRKGMAVVAAECIIAALKGEVPRHVVNREVLGAD